MELKYAIRKLLKTKVASDSAEELTEMFLIPFYQNITNSRITPENAVDLFFNAETRHFFYCRANREFRMPGKYVDPRKEGDIGSGNRKIPQGKVMLCVADIPSRTTKIMVKARDKFDEFVLSEVEMSILKRLIDVI